MVGRAVRAKAAGGLACAAALPSLVCGCGSAASGSPPPRPAEKQSLAGSPIPEGAPALPFALRDQNGTLVRLQAQRGHTVLLTFLYTRCQDVCPLIAERLDRIARRHPSVRVLAVSIDPVGDTAAATRRYVREHGLGREFHWLIGTRTQLARVWQNYNILVERRSRDQVAHAAPVYLIDRRGRPRVLYAPPPSATAIAHDLKLVLAS